MSTHHARYISWDEAGALARKMMAAIRHEHDAPVAVYGIPRGGNYVAALLAGHGIAVADEPGDADLLVDDIIDSGRTANRWLETFGLKTYALIDREQDGLEPGLWIEFPWEEGGIERDAADTVVRLIEQIGDDPNRPGLSGTPERVVGSWDDRYAGYDEDPSALAAAVHPEEHEHALDGDPAVIRGIPFTSTCERLMHPFDGAVDVVYLPEEGRFITPGVFTAGQLKRVVDAVSRRLTTADAIAGGVAGAFLDSPYVSACAVRVATWQCCPVESGPTPHPDVLADAIRSEPGISEGQLRTLQIAIGGPRSSRPD